MPPRPAVVSRWIVALSALAMAASFARAQQGTPPVSDAAKDLIGGAWEISNSDRDKRCPVTFSIDAVPGGYKIELDPACAILPLKDVVAWGLGPKDVLRLLDAKNVPQSSSARAGAARTESTARARGWTS